MSRRAARPGRRRLALAVAAGAVVLAGAAGAAAVGGQAPPEPPATVAQLRQEVAALRAEGLPADHPKVRMLEREIAALVAGATATTEPDPGLAGGPAPGRGDRGARAETPVEAAELADDLAAEQAAEAGPVECEPVPHVLDADEAADAVVCVSVPQPDGTSRYLAVAPDGTVHVVRFGNDGRVTRLDDRELPADAVEAAGDDAPQGGDGLDGVELVPEEDGSVAVRSGDDELGTLDVG